MNELTRPTTEQYAKKLAIKGDDEKELDFINSYDWSPIVYEENGKYGLKNCIGEQLTDAKYDDFRLLSAHDLKIGARTVASIGKSEGIIILDGKGEWLVEPNYDYISYPNSIVGLFKDKKCGVMNLETKEWILPMEYDSISIENGFLFCNGIAFFDKNGKHGILNEDGKCTEAIFDEIEYDIEGSVRVRFGEEWGFVNEDGEFTLDEDESYFYYEV